MTGQRPELLTFYSAGADTINELVLSCKEYADIRDDRDQ